jgi:DNA/RNA-binding domain of Phe-tRNA-synthetase-like protein
LSEPAPFTADDAVRKLIRDLLRQGGFKPTGRSKPASEYLLKAASSGSLTSINLAVDACNVVSLHSGLPISVVDLDLTRPPLRVQIADKGQSYVFNKSGQSIDIGGLLCLFDAQGACANGVKDSQRTKTHDGTLRTMSILWGTSALPGRVDQARDWYQRLLQSCGCQTEDVPLTATEPPSNVFRDVK